MLDGIMFAMFSIGLAAAEAAVGLGLIIAVYRHFQSTNLEELDEMKG